MPTIDTGTKRSVEKGKNVTFFWERNPELLLQSCVPWELFPPLVLASLGLRCCHCLFPHRNKEKWAAFLTQPPGTAGMLFCFSPAFPWFNNIKIVGCVGTGEPVYCIAPYNSCELLYNKSVEYIFDKKDISVKGWQVLEG